MFRSRKPEAIVFAGDGQGISKWGRLLEKAEVPSTMVVGVHGLTDEMKRIYEYSPGFAPESFAAHEKFFVEDVRRWTETQFTWRCPLNAPRCSESRQEESWPSHLGCGIHMSLVRCCVPRLAVDTSRLASCLVRFRAHTLLPAHRSRSSLENAMRWAEALRDADAEVVMHERTGSHGGAFWQEEFPLMVACGHLGDDRLA